CPEKDACRSCAHNDPGASRSTGQNPLCPQSLRRAKPACVHIQNKNFKANCNCRLLSQVEVICPKAGPPSAAFGALNCGVLNILNDSSLNWNRCFSLTGNSLNSPTSQVFMAGCRSVFRPTSPNFKFVN